MATGAGGGGSAADRLSLDEWETVAVHMSMHARSLLIGVSRTTRDAVVRAMAIALSEGARVRLLHDQIFARVSAVLLRRSIFLTGGAGVGKTTTCSTILDDLAHWFETPHERVEHARALEAHRAAAAEVAAVLVSEAGRGTVASSVPPTPLPHVPPAPRKPPKLNTLVTASTGAAARLINGHTLHAAFNIRSQPRRADGLRVVPDQLDNGAELRDPLDAYHDDEYAQYDGDADGDGTGQDEDAPSYEWAVVVLDKALRSTLQKLDVLLIDEISMVDGDLLDLLDAACREARGAPDAPFGGLYVLPVGDFCQLPPVITPQTAVDGGRHGFAFRSEAWRALAPRVVDLVVPVRQDASDPARQRFIEVLGRCRWGRAQSVDLKWLMDNGYQEPRRPPGTGLGELPLLLTTRKEIRNARNAEMLGRIAGETRARDAANHSDLCDLCRVRVGGKDVRTGEPYALHDPRAWDTVGPPGFRLFHHKKATDTFEFKVGARVRCTRNVYGKSDDGGQRKLIVPNGAVGTILGYDLEPGTHNLVAEVNVRWDKASRTVDAFERVHKPAWFDRVQRRSYPHPTHGDLPLKAVRKQLSLDICFAKTIHSAQGTSIYEPTDLCINLNRAPPPPSKPGQPAGPKIFPAIHGLCYTALSRFASERLIRHWYAHGAQRRVCSPEDVWCDPLVRDFYDNNGSRAPQWLKDAVGPVTLHD
jgi:hypothetical protein